ncbi:MAG TPA: acyl-CoA dehydrogenase family protein [Methylomirabilota bacterium]|nr:acyl-CoA dehydrogenase family protein [Methylomirabilota bacterium]
MTPAQQALRARARELADGVFRDRAARWDAEEAYPWDNVKDLVRAGFMGLTIPTAYGGAGASVLDVLLVVEQVARQCGVTARIVVEGSLGVVGALAAYGTEAQKRRYFPWVVEDGEKPAIAITEPEAGSAATDLVTRADEAPEGWTLAGEKRWITGAGTSRLYLVYCRMGAREGAEGIGGLLVERDTPGFTIGERDRTMGLRGIPEGRLHFDRCRVPREQVLVGPPDGFKKLMRAYNSQRLGAATVALGLAQGAYEHALAYAQARRQFGRPIADFQGIRWKLADMAIALDAARLLIHRAACTEVDGFPDPLESAKAKTFAAETAQAVTSQALQIHGAAGYGRGLPLERMMRDARMFAIGGGTVEMMRNLIADRILPGKADFRR